MAAERRMAGFSIETDDEVLVNFADGSAARLKKSQLHQKLEKDDVAQINRGFRLRQSFWRRHLPRGLAVAVAGTAVAAALVVSGRPLTHLVVPQKLTASQAGSQVQPVSSIPTASPTPKPQASPLAASSSAPSSPNEAPSAGGNGSKVPSLVHGVTAGLGRVLK